MSLRRGVYHNPGPLMEGNGVSFAKEKCALALAGALLLGTACNREEEGDWTPWTEEPQAPVQSIENVRFAYSERGTVKHVLIAHQLSRTTRTRADEDSDAPTEGLILVEGGFTLFVDGDEQLHQASLSAQRGTLDEAHMRLEAEDKVVVTNRVGDRLETEYLVWSSDSDRVYTHRPVAIYTATGVIRGEGLESDNRFENYRILRPTGEIEVPDLNESPGPN